MHLGLAGADSDLRKAAPASLTVGSDLERVHTAVETSLAAHAVCRVAHQASRRLRAVDRHGGTSACSVPRVVV